MKKLFIQAATLCSMLCFHSCNNEIEVTKPQEVEFTIDYSFSSGSMSRSTNDEIYTKFYEDHIKTREITPDNYAFTFTNKETGQINEIRGLWSENNLIRLPEGTYVVKGNSYDGDGIYVKDKVVLSFDTETTISNSTNSITLKANYNCSLVFFSAELTDKVRYRSGVKGSNGYTEVIEDLKVLDNYHYCFVKGFSESDNSYFEINRINGKIPKVFTKNLNLENGKYYFFNNLTGGFDLDPMTPDN